MRIIIVGLPLFSERLRDRLAAFDKSNTYKRFDTYYSLIDGIKAMLAVKRADCIYSINGTLSKSRLINFALKNNIPVIMSWVGTDVINALRAYKSGNYQKEYVNGVVHRCEVGWIQQELTEMNIEAKIVNFASFPVVEKPRPASSEKLTVLSYIADSRADFYGMNELLRLAQKFSEVDFIIVGTKGEKYQPLPNNVEALGWIENMDEIYNRTHVCVRFPEHDGLSNFILEALARGKRVLYKYPLDHCEECPDEKSLEANLRKLQDLHASGDGLLNEEGTQFIKLNFNEKKILGGLVDQFNTLSHQG